MGNFKSTVKIAFFALGAYWLYNKCNTGDKYGINDGVLQDSMETIVEKGNYPTVNSSKVESLADHIDAMAASNTEMRKTLYLILREMDDIAGDAFALEREREQTGAVKDLNVVDRITKRIECVKEQIEIARKQVVEDHSLLSQIDQMKASLKRREEEIRHLRTSFINKSKQLQEQLDSLEEENGELQLRRDVLKADKESFKDEKSRLNSLLATSWNVAGDKLMRSLNEIKVKTNRKGEIIDKLPNEVHNARIRIVQRVINCYENACYYGDSTADAKVKTAKDMLQRLLSGEDM